ncbi:MAG: hypothetical protein B6I17_04165 [Tenericutes bacterium 4572_104]|nr:MAG: hypothetical protein B6I17_04165 [Tenericutes bacterium 4572_104]
MGWDDVNKDFQFMDNPNQIPFDDQFKIADLGTELFTSQIGQEFMKLLEKYYLAQPVAHYTFTDAFSRIREGQNDIIRFFKSLPDRKQKMIDLKTQQSKQKEVKL